MAGPEPLPKAAVHAFSLFRHLSDGLRCYLSLVLPDSRNKQRALTVRQKRIITLQMCRALLLCPHRDSRKALMALMNRPYALSVRGITRISRPKYLFQFTVKPSAADSHTRWVCRGQIAENQKDASAPGHRRPWNAPNHRSFVWNQKMLPLKSSAYIHFGKAPSLFDKDLPNPNLGWVTWPAHVLHN